MSAADTIFPGVQKATQAAGRVAGLNPPVPIPPAPPTALPAAPNAASALDRLRANREAADSAGRKRGRAASIFTGPEGVAPNATPLGFKTLVGS